MGFQKSSLTPFAVYWIPWDVGGQLGPRNWLQMSARLSGTTASLEKGEKSLNIWDITNQTSVFGPMADMEFYDDLWTNS
jgi:hypothetical protein